MSDDSDLSNTPPTSFSHSSSMCFSQSIVQPKDNIMHVVLSRRRSDQMKEFTKMQWIVSSNFDSPGNKNDDCVGIGRGLDVGSFDRV